MTVPFEVSSVIERNLGLMRNQLAREMAERDERRADLDALISRVSEMEGTIRRIETWLAGEQVMHHPV